MSGLFKRRNIILLISFLIVLPVMVFVYSLASMFFPELWRLQTRILNPLHYAVQIDDVDRVKMLVKFGIFTNQQFPYYMKPTCVGTPAEFAIRANAYNSLKILLENGAEFTGCRPLLYTAIKEGNLQIVEFLIEKGADIHERVDGASYLSHAAGRSCDEKAPASQILIYLLDQKLDVNARRHYSKDKILDRDTPLYSAAVGNCLNNVAILLQYGANKNVIIHGKSIVEYLQSINRKDNDYSDVIEILSNK